MRNHHTWLEEHWANGSGVNWFGKYNKECEKSDHWYIRVLLTLNYSMNRNVLVTFDGLCLFMNMMR